MNKKESKEFNCTAENIKAVTKDLKSLNIDCSHGQSYDKLVFEIQIRNTIYNVALKQDETKETVTTFSEVIAKLKK